MGKKVEKKNQNKKLDMCLCTNTEVFPSVMCKKRFELIIAKYLKRIRVAPLRLRDM